MTLDRRQSVGFSLLEVLVAMSMIAVLAGSFYATLHTAFKARGSAARAVEPVRQIELALELLRDDLQSAMIPRGLLAGEFTGEDLVDTEGRPGDSVLVHCALGAAEHANSGGDIRKVELVCETSEETGAMLLVRYVTGNLLATAAEEPRREVICRDIEAFDVRYFDGADWQESWDSIVQGDVLPLAVEVTIQLPADPDASDGLDGYAATRAFLIPCSSLQPGISAGMQMGMEAGR